MSRSRSWMCPIISILMLGQSITDLWAGFSAADVLVIPWGNGSEQLKIGPPYTEDVNFTPDDSTDDVVFQGGGPQDGFVDNQDNVYFSSYVFHYFKGFDIDGQLIVDYSRWETNYNPDFYRSDVSAFYVDTLGYIYFISFPAFDYVAVADRDNNLIAKLTPFGLESGVEAVNMFFNSSDVLAIYFKQGYYTYENGNFQAGGSAGWRTQNGDYYYLRRGDNTILTFEQFQNPDLNGVAQSINVTNVNLGFEFNYVHLLAVDDDMLIYALIGESDGISRRIEIFSLDYDLIEEVILAPLDDYYSWAIKPFVRKDGTIFEFRCLTDGLHVIRWSDE